MPARQPFSRTLSRRQALRHLTTAAAGASVLLASGAHAEARWGLQVTRNSLNIAGLRAPLKVAFLSDLHIGPLFAASNARAWVRAAMTEEPDLILLGGDYMDSSSSQQPGQQFTELLKELSGLSARLGVWGVWGNHDYSTWGRVRSGGSFIEVADWRKNRALATEICKEHGVRMLRNESAELENGLQLVGLDDWKFGTRPQLNELLGPKERGVRMVLSHNPDVLPNLPAHSDFVLCGHTHGGQVRVPLVGALIVPSDYGTTYDMGFKTGAFDTPAYISRGLGCSRIPIRLFCRPELCIFDLRPT